jgi:hypothetical protein
MANDARKKLRLVIFITHEFGLAWEESYDKICDATQMLFQAANMGRVLKKRRHMSPIHIGTIRQEQLIYCLILRNQFKTHQEYLDFGMLL